LIADYHPNILKYEEDCKRKLHDIKRDCEALKMDHVVVSDLTAALATRGVENGESDPEDLEATLG
jgi:hypothetical protein